MTNVESRFGVGDLVQVRHDVPGGNPRTPRYLRGWTGVVVASYDIGDNMRGLVGVVGPTRMDYAAVAARLSYFAESLSRMFGKKQLPEDTQ